MMSLKSPRFKDFRCRQIGYEAISYSRQRRLEITQCDWNLCCSGDFAGRLFSLFFLFFFSFSKAACLCFHSPLSLSFFDFFFLSFEVDTQCCNSPSFLSSENQKNHTFFFMHLVSNSYKLSRRADGMMFQRNLHGHTRL